MRQTHLSPQFVEFIPERLEEGILYISQRYGTAAHNCCCGCGKEVITPLTPTDWSLRKDGNGVTLQPSIGNWSLPCRSHYWIRRNEVIWAGQMSQQRIEHGRAINRATKQAYFEAVNRKKEMSSNSSSKEASHQNSDCGLHNSFWRVIKRWWNS